MVISNRSKLDTDYLIEVFYRVGHRARLTTVDLRVEVRAARHLLHGIAYKSKKLIIMWLPADAKEDGIAYLFAHELRHIHAPKTLRKKKAKEMDANRFAEKVTGIEGKEVIWRSPKWVSLRRKYSVLRMAETDLRTYQDKYPQHDFRIALVSGFYRIQWKTGKGWIKRA